MRTLAEAPLNVLVADDIPSSRDALADLVRQLGHRCEIAASGKETLELVQALEPDLVLLDLLMPDLDGFEVTRILRERVTHRWLPVVVTSSLRDEGDAHFIAALSQGADDFLARPVNPALLEAKLRHYGRVLGLQGSLAGLARRQQAIHDHIADPVLTLDAARRVVEANRAAARLFRGADDADLAGATLQELAGIAEADLRQARELEVRGADGVARPMAVANVDWSLGAQSFSTVTLHDLSEQRAVERMKDEFLAGVSHELRTPLTSIVGALGLLAAGAAGALPARVRQLLEVAQRNGERLARLIDDVLDLTKLEGNGMTMRLRPHPLGPLVAEAVAANAGYAARHGVQVVQRLPEGPAQARVDADRLQQVLANLLSNAVKHSPRDRPVEVTLRGTPRGWRLDVRDHGPGVDPAFRDRLFAKFAQADASDRRARGGTGLGLYISRMLVERMGGRIEVTSEPGQGATFSVLVPSDPGAPGWLLVVVRDHQRGGRLEHWLAPLVPVELAVDVEAARAAVARRGPPAAVVADPLGQEPIDRFCAGLRELSPRVLLTGDPLDAAFQHQLGLPWIGLADASASAGAALAGWVQGNDLQRKGWA